MQHAWNAYGESAFEFVVIEECLLSELTAREQYHLDLLRLTTEVFNTGLAADCPARGRKFGPQSEHSKLARSQALKGRPRSAAHRHNLSLSLTGRSFSEETKEKIRAAKTGRPLTAEHKAKLSQARKGKPHPVNEQARQKLIERNKSMKRTDATLEKMRKSSLGRTHTPEVKAKCAAAARQYWITKKKEPSK